MDNRPKQIVEGFYNHLIRDNYSVDNIGRNVDEFADKLANDEVFSNSAYEYLKKNIDYKKSKAELMISLLGSRAVPDAKEKNLSVAIPHALPQQPKGVIDREQREWYSIPTFDFDNKKEIERLNRAAASQPPVQKGTPSANKDKLLTDNDKLALNVMMNNSRANLDMLAGKKIEAEQPKYNMLNRPNVVTKQLDKVFSEDRKAAEMTTEIVEYLKANPDFTIAQSAGLSESDRIKYGITADKDNTQVFDKLNKTLGLTPEERLANMTKQEKEQVYRQIQSLEAAKSLQPEIEALAKRLNEATKSRNNEYFEKFADTRFWFEDPKISHMRAQATMPTDYLTPAIEQLKQAQQIMSAPDKDSSGWGAFFKGMKDGVDIGDIVTMGLGDLSDNLLIKGVVDRYEKDPNSLDENERLLLDAIALNTSAQILFMPRVNKRYFAGKSTGESLTFMAQMLATGGIGRGATGALTKAVGKYIVKNSGKIAQRLAARGFGRTAMKAGLGLANSAVSASAMTPFMPQTYSNILEQQTGVVHRTAKNKLGEPMEYDVEVADKNIPLINSVLDSGIEVFSEMLGRHISKGMGMAGKGFVRGLEKAIPKLPTSTIYQRVLEISDFLNTSNDFLNKYFAKQGFVEENVEEFAGNALRYITGVSTIEELREQFGKDGIVNQMLSLAPMSVIGLRANNLNRAKLSYDKYLAEKRLRSTLKGYGFASGEVNDFVSGIMNGTSEDLAKRVDDLIRKVGGIMDNGTLNDVGVQISRQVVDFVFKSARREVGEAYDAKALSNNDDIRQTAEDAMREAEAEFAKQYEGYTNETTGRILLLQEDGGDRKIAVVRGNVVYGEDGTIDLDKSDELIYYRDDDGSVKPLSLRSLGNKYNRVVEDVTIGDKMSESASGRMARNAAAYPVGSLVIDKNGDSSPVVRVTENGVVVETVDENGRIGLQELPISSIEDGTFGVYPEVVQGDEHELNGIKYTVLDVATEDKVSTAFGNPIELKEGNVLLYEPIRGELRTISKVSELYGYGQESGGVQKAKAKRDSLSVAEGDSVDVDGSNWVVLAVADKDGRHSYGGREIGLKKGNVLLLGVGGEGLRVFESAADLYRGREKQVSPNENSAETQGVSENNRNLQEVQGNGTQKSVITDENQTVTQEKKVVLNTEQAEHLLSLMEQNAEAIPTLKLTPDNWVAEFGESGVVQTPIGDVKMGDGQFLKMSAKERKGQFGMVKPTLTNPDIVIKEYSPAMGVERDAKLLFVKTFTDENGNKHIHFESVTVQKDNREVVVSNHRLRENQLLNKMKSGQIVYKSTALDTSEQVSADNQTNTDIGATSQGKGRINSAHTQEEFYSTLPKNDKGEIDEAQMTAEQRIRYAEYELGDDRSELLGYMQDQITALESQISTLNEKEGKSISERKMLAQMKADRALFGDYMREQTEPTPIGYGAFGAIYDQFKGKAREAIAFLKSKKSGDALGALHHKDIGDIDLVWGNEGTGKSDGFGLAKLVKYHPEVVDDLQEVLNDMRITSRSDNRINLESGSHQASVRLDWDSERKTWLLTAFEKKNSVSTNTTDTVGTLEESKVNDTATHQNTVSDDKGTTNLDNKQAIGNKKRGRPIFNTKRIKELKVLRPIDISEVGTEEQLRLFLMFEFAQGKVSLKWKDNVNSAGEITSYGLQKETGYGWKDLPPYVKTGKNTPAQYAEWLVNNSALPSDFAALDTVLDMVQDYGYCNNAMDALEEMDSNAGNYTLQEDEYWGNLDYLHDAVADDIFIALEENNLLDLDNFNTFAELEEAIGNMDLTTVLSDEQIEYITKYVNNANYYKIDYEEYRRQQANKAAQKSYASGSEHGGNEDVERGEEDDDFGKRQHFDEVEEDNNHIDNDDSPVPFRALSDSVVQGQRKAIDAAVAEVEPNPTEAQKRAGNYKKGHVNIQGFDITIENPKGSVRRGTDAKGRAWENTMQNHYGYFKRTEGKDGDHIDVFVGDYPSSEKIFVIDQNNPETKEFDESKVMLGFNSVDEAKKAYMSNYEDNWQGFGAITETTVDEFKRWLYDGARQRKAFGEYKDVIDKQTERRRAIAQEVQRAIGIEINLVESADELPDSEGKARRAIDNGLNVKAWYNPKTGKAYLYVPNIADRADAERSILHEVVAHKGLRDLLGQDRFDGLCDKVYDSIGRKDKVKYGSYVLYGRDNVSLSLQDLSKIFGDTDTRRAIADEYIAHLAEGGVDNPTVWDKIVDWVRELLRDMGFGVRISERDIRYMLGRSKENLQRQSKEAGENNKNNATENRFRFTENKKNSNFVKNRQDDSSTRETVLGNGQTVGNRSVREALGKHEKGSEIYRTIQTSYTGGSVGTILSVEEREELEARGINPDWDRRQFLSKLKDEAQKNNVWLDNTYLNDKTLLHDQKARQTSENDVYLNADGKTLTKLNNLSYVTSAEHERNLFAFIDRIDAHNNLFPNVAYNIVGFMDNKNGNTAMVLEQPYISSERNATQDEINDYLTSIGFQLDGKRGWSNEHPVWTNGKYELFDARPANVLKDEDGSLYFIDVVPHSVEYMDNDSDMRFRLTDEEQSIKEEAMSNGTFMKAPNGKATNLNEKQWLQVRTDAFKKWFGDWEKAARIEKLKKANPIEMTGKEYEGKYELNRDSARDWALSNLRGKYTNKNTKESIFVGKVGIKEVTSHSSHNAEHLKSLVAIPDIIENTIFIDELPNEKNNDKYDSYRYYVGGLKIDGEDYTVKMVVGVKGGNKYYDHRLTQIEKGKLIDQINDQSAKKGFTTTGDAPLQSYALSDYKDRKLISLLQTNSSKVVDENGEPMVVYHGTPKFGFTVFDKEFSDDKTGIFFANKADIAKGYAGVNADVKSLSQDNSNNDLSKDEILSVMFEDVDTSLTDGYDAAGILSYVAPDIAISVEYGEDDGFTAPEDIGVLTLNSSYSGDTYRLTPDEYSWDKVLDWLRYNADLEAVVDSEAGVYGVFINAPNILNVDAGGAVWSFIPKNRVPGAGDTGFMNTRDITKLAKEQGYDGVYIKELQDAGGRGYGLVGDVQGDIFISLVDGSQIKSATDNVGAFDEANDDIRFRITDEEYLSAVESGNVELAQQMVDEAAERAMPNSKVRGKDGKLLKVYHGTQSAGFNVFDKRFMGRNATGDGHGFYFTTDRNYAKGFSGEEGKIFTVYLDISRPISKDKLTITRLQAKKILQEINSRQKEDGIDYFLSNYGDVEREGYNNVLNEALELEYGNSENDVEFVGGLINSSGNLYDVAEALEKVTGRQGIIVDKGDQTHYIVSNPNAIKSADAVTYDDNGNVIPLSERFNLETDDIRYRLTDEEQVKAIEADLREVADIYDDIAEARYRIAMSSEPTKEEYAEQIREGREKRLTYLKPTSPQVDAELFDSLSKSTNSKGMRFLERTADQYIMVKKLFEEMRKGGYQIADVNDWYMRITAMSGQNQAEYEKYRAERGAPLQEQLSKIMREKKMTLRDMENYVILKHGKERNEYYATRDAKLGLQVLDDYSGVTAVMRELREEHAHINDTASLDEAIAWFENHIGKEDVAELWERINHATEHIIENQIASGLISDKRGKKVLGMWKHFVPLRGFDTGAASEEFDYDLNGATIFFDYVVPQALGRNSRSTSPFAYIDQMNGITIKQKNKNLLNRSFARLARLSEAKGDGLLFVARAYKLPDYIEDKNGRRIEGAKRKGDHIVDKDGRRIEGAREVKGEVLSPPDYVEDVSEYNRLIKEWQAKMRRGVESGIYEEVERPVPNFGMFVSPFGAKQHVVRVYEAGKPVDVVFNMPPAIPRAINELNHEQAIRDRAIWRAMQWTTRAMAKNVTTRRLSFVGKNFARDVLFANAMLATKEDFTYRNNFKANLLKCSPTVMRYVSGRTLLGWTVSGKESLEDNKYGQYLTEFVMLGGKTGFSSIMRVDELAQEYAKQVERGGADKRDLLALITAMNEYAETITRFAAYVTSREAGRSKERAISDAKELTLNFNRQGTKGGIFGHIKSLCMFANASIQALLAFSRMAKANPLKTLDIVSQYVALAITNALVWELFKGEDDDSYWRLSKHDRQNNLCLPTGNGWMKIPLSQELRIFYMIGDEVATCVMRGQDFDKAMFNIAVGLTDMLPSFSQGAIPLEEMLEGKNKLSSVLFAQQPITSIQPVTQAIANLNFMNYKIYDDTPYGGKRKELPAWRKALRNRAGKPYSPNVLIWGSRGLNTLTGGNEAEQGLADVSPDVVNHLLSGYFGGIYGTIVAGINLTESSISSIKNRRNDFNSKDVPLFRSFYTSSDNMRATDDVLNAKYMDLLQKAKRKIAVYENYMDSSLDEKLRKGKASEFEDIGVWRQIKNSQKQINRLKELAAEATDPIDRKGYIADMEQAMRSLLDMGEKAK